MAIHADMLCVINFAGELVYDTENCYVLVSWWNGIDYNGTPGGVVWKGGAQLACVPKLVLHCMCLVSEMIFCIEHYVLGIVCCMVGCLGLQACLVYCVYSSLGWR